MANLNKVFLMGRLTRDPELRFTPKGTAVCDLGLAVDTGWGENKQTCFVDVTVWSKSAEIVAEYCSKGKELFIEGRLELHRWEGQDQQKRSKLRVVCERFQFIGSRGPQKEGDSGASEEPAGAPPSDDNFNTNLKEDGDIPF